MAVLKPKVNPGKHMSNAKVNTGEGETKGVGVAVVMIGVERKSRMEGSMGTVFRLLSKAVY